MINPDYPVETGNFIEHTYQNQQPQFNMNNGFYYPGVNPAMMNGGFTDASARPVPPTPEEFNAMSMGQPVNPMFNQFNNVPPYNGTQFSQPTMEQCGYQQPNYNPYQTNYGGMQMPYQNPTPNVPQMQQQTQNPWAMCQQQNPFDPGYNATMYNQYNAAPTTKKTQQWDMSNVPIKPQMPTANWQQYIPNNYQQNAAPTYPSIPVPADIAQQSQSLLNLAKQNWG